MREYFQINPADQKKQNYIFWRYDRSKMKMVVRESYEDLVCGECGKLDECSAIRRGIEKGVSVKSNDDYVMTEDDWICVSKRLKSILLEYQVGGLEFHPIPNDPSYFVVLPSSRVLVDLKKSGMEFFGPHKTRELYKSRGISFGYPINFEESCPVCGRFFEVLQSPCVDSLSGLPCSDTVFATSIL